jgi:hypothetical protein
LDDTKAETQALRQGEVVTQSFVVRVTDDKGAYVDQTVVVTINGTNDIPVVTNAVAAKAGSVTEVGDGVAGTAMATGTLTTSDVDASATKTWSLVGANSSTYGAFTVNAITGKWTYVLDDTLDATRPSRRAPR